MFDLHIGEFLNCQAESLILLISSYLCLLWTVDAQHPCVKELFLQEFEVQLVLGLAGLFEGVANFEPYENTNVPTKLTFLRRDGTNALLISVLYRLSETRLTLAFQTAAPMTQDFVDPFSEKSSIDATAGWEEISQWVLLAMMIGLIVGPLLRGAFLLLRNRRGDWSQIILAEFDVYHTFVFTSVKLGAGLLLFSNTLLALVTYSWTSPAWWSVAFYSLNLSLAFADVIPTIVAVVLNIFILNGMKGLMAT